MKHCMARTRYIPVRVRSLARIRARLSLIRLSNGHGSGPLVMPLGMTLSTVRRVQPLSPIKCFNSLKPSKKDTKTPARHAIANGLAIGHIPSVLMIDVEDEPRQKQGLTNKNFSDIRSTAVSHHRPYGFIFAFIGGAHQSVIGQFSFLT